MEAINTQDKICGSLIGGVIGDALGYPVEFISSFEKIQKRYGQAGITLFDLRPIGLMRAIGQVKPQG